MHFNKQELIQKAKQLLAENTSAEQIALGTAIGVFIGLSPFYGLHTVIALAVALVIKKANKLALLLGIQISFPPVVPLIYFFEYKIGKALLLRDEEYSEKFFASGLSFAAEMNVKFLALLAGSVILGILAAACTYVCTAFLVNKYRRKRLRETAAGMPLK
jgi:hypothetical protein